MLAFGGCRHCVAVAGMTLHGVEPKGAQRTRLREPKLNHSWTCDGKIFHVMFLAGAWCCAMTGGWRHCGMDLLGEPALANSWFMLGAVQKAQTPSFAFCFLKNMNYGDKHVGRECPCATDMRWVHSKLQVSISAWEGCRGRDWFRPCVLPTLCRPCWFRDFLHLRLH